MSDLTPQTPQKGPTRVDKHNALVDSEVKKVLDDLEIVSSDLDAIMEVIKDRLIQSTDASFPIALARLGELRLDTIKKRVDILKLLVNDKSVEVMGKKKTPATDLESILSGAAFSAALGAKVGSGGFGLSQSKLSNNIENDIIDVSKEELVIETEVLNNSNSNIEDLLGKSDE
jgi:DNA-directed RNA polymerase subunit H (RpoH/RPB5)